MKILMFGWEFPPSISGGLGTACQGLAEGLAETGAEIVFVAPRAVEHGPRYRLRFVDGSLPLPDGRDSHAGTVLAGILERPVNILLAPYMTEESYDELLAMTETGEQESGSDREFQYRYGDDMYEEVSRYAMNARAIARKEQCDIITSHDWMAIPAGMAAREAVGAPLVVHVHSLESDRSPLRINEHIYGIERFGMLAADLVIAVSHYTKKKIIEQYGISAGKIAVIHNATPSFPEKDAGRGNRQYSPPGKNVLFLGRITRQKGPEYFVEAAARVIAEDREVRFIVAGSGESEAAMKEWVRAAGIAEQFDFTGFLRRCDVAEVFTMSTLYVMPSLSEPFGITALEAIRYGVPVILSNRCGVSEVLPHCPTVDFGDAEGLAQVIQNVLADGALQQEIVRAGREDMKALTWPSQAALLLEQYRIAISERNMKSVQNEKQGNREMQLNVDR